MKMLLLLTMLAVVLVSPHAKAHSEEEMHWQEEPDYWDPDVDWVSDNPATVAEEDINPGIGFFPPEKLQELEKITEDSIPIRLYIKNVEAVGKGFDLEIGFLGSFFYEMRGEDRIFVYDPPEKIKFRFYDARGNYVGGFVLKNAFEFANETARFEGRKVLARKPAYVKAYLGREQIACADIPQPSSVPGESFELVAVYRPREGNIAFAVEGQDLDDSYKGVRAFYADFLDENGVYSSSAAYPFEVKFDEYNFGMSPMFASIDPTMTKGFVVLKDAEGNELSRMYFDFAGSCLCEKSGR